MFVVGQDEFVDAVHPPGRRGPGQGQLFQLGPLPGIEHDNERTRQCHGHPEQRISMMIR